MGMAFFGREVESFASFDRACLALLEALPLGAVEPVTCTSGLAACHVLLANGCRMGEFSVEEMELSGRPVPWLLMLRGFFAASFRAQ